MLRILSIFTLSVIMSPAFAQLSSISNADASSGLKQALNDGSIAAIAKLGVENGFFANPQVKIPLPPALKKVEGALRLAGMKKQADELVLSMNRAAEQAVPEAKQLLADAVSKMTLQDAKRPSLIISAAPPARSSRSAFCLLSKNQRSALASPSNTTHSPDKAFRWD